jgi:hypothetical protein
VIIGDTRHRSQGGDTPAYQGWLETFRGPDTTGVPAWMWTGASGWPQEIKSMTEYGEQAGLPMGMMYFGNGVDRSDEGWISAAGERVKKLELEAGASPQHVLFQSWNDKPDFVLPESQAYTWTNFINAYFADKSALGYRRSEANLALGKPMRVTAVRDQPARWRGYDTERFGAQVTALQWIGSILADRTVAQINLTTSQYPIGPGAPATGSNKRDFSWCHREAMVTVADISANAGAYRRAVRPCGTTGPSWWRKLGRGDCGSRGYCSAPLEASSETGQVRRTRERRCVEDAIISLVFGTST